MTPVSYKDPFWSSLAEKVEQEVGLPANLLQNILLKGERSNADQVSSAGAKTPFQVIPETRQALLKKYNVDAYAGPEQAAKAAALLLKESLDRNQGDITQAVGEYIGGTNRKNWGPVTNAYIQRVTTEGKPMVTAQQFQNIYKAYESGQMSSQEAQEFEADMNAGVFGNMAAKAPQKAVRPPAAQQPIQLPSGVVKAYREGRMTPQERSELEADIQAGLVAMPSSSNAAVTPNAAEAIKTPPSMGESLVQGAIVDPIAGGAQLLTNLLPDSVVSAGNRLNNFLAEKTGLVAPIPQGGVNELVKTQQKDYEARQGGGLDIPRLAGTVLSPVNFALGASAPAAASAVGRIATGAGLGAAAGALQPVVADDYGSQLAKNVAMGAAVGGVASSAGEAISRVISPKASTNADLKLMKELGVDVTPGQALGKTASKLEQKASSVPLMGSQIEARRTKALEQFSKAMFNKAGKSIGFNTNKTGFDAVSDLDTAVNQAYKKAVEQTKAVRVDDRFLTSASNLSEMAAEVADNGATKKALDTQLDKILSKVTKAGAILPETWKEFDSSLGQIAKKTGNMDYKNAIRELQREWRSMAARSNPRQAKLFKNADSAYSQLSVLERAAENAAKQEGVFSPNQLYRASKANAFTKTQVRQKTAPFMKEALAAERVLGSSVPNSGTAERLLTGGLIGGAGVGLNPAIIAAPVLGGLAYTGAGSKALTGLVSSRPNVAQPIAEAIQKSSPLLGLFAPQILQQ